MAIGNGVGTRNGILVKKILGRGRMAVAGVIAMAVAGAAFVPAASGATNILWTGTTSTAWATGTNWTGGNAPQNDLTTNIAEFDATSYTNMPNAGTTSVNGIQVGDGTIVAVVTLSGTQLTIGSGGINVMAKAGAVTVSSPVIIGASQSWTDATTNALTVSGSITGSSSSPTILTLSNTSSGATTLSNVIADGSGVGNTLALVINNTGSGATTLGTLTTTNSYTGGTTILSGTVSALASPNTNGLGTGPITMGNISGSANTEIISGSGSNTNTLIYSNLITVVAGNTGTATISAQNNTTLNGLITLNHDLNLDASSTRTLTVAGGTAGSGGNLILLSNSNAGIVLSGTIINHAGSISIAAASTFADTISASIGSNVTDIIHNGANSLTISGSSVANSGNITFSNAGASTVSITSAATINNTGFILNNGTTTGTTTISGVIGANVTGVTENSLTSPMVLANAANTYTSATTVTAGQLTATNVAALAATSGISISAAGRFDFTAAGTLHIGTAGTLSIANGGTVGVGLTSTINAPGGVTATGAVNLALDSTTPSVTTYHVLTAASGLSGATYFVVNPTNFSFNLSGSNDTAVNINVTAVGVSPLPTAYFIGGMTGNSGSWAASNGTISNWTTDGSTTTALVPSVGTSVFLSSPSVSLSDQAAMILDSNMSMKTIEVNNSNPVTLNANGYTLTVVGDGTNGITLDSGSGAVTLNPNVTLTGSQAWTNNSSSNLTINSPLAVTLSGTVHTLTFNGTGTGAIVVNAPLTGATWNVVVNTSGAVTLAGANTFTSGVTLTAGTLNINNAKALGTGTFTINGGTIDNTSAGAVTLGAIPMIWNSDFAFTGTQSLSLGTGAVSMVATAQRTITLSSSSHILTVGGVINDSGKGIIVTGAGTLALNGANTTFTGGLFINSGTVSLGAANSAGTQPITLGVSAGGSASVLSTFNGTIASTITLAANVAGTLTIGTNLAVGGASTFSSPINLMNDNVTFANTSFINGYVLNIMGGINGTGNITVFDNPNSTSNGDIKFTGFVNNSGTITDASNDPTNSGGNDPKNQFTGGIGSNVTSITENSINTALQITGALTVNGSGTTLITSITANAGIATPLAVSGGVNGTGDLVLQNNGNTAGGIAISGGSVNNQGMITNSGNGTGTVTIIGGVGSNVTAITESSATSALTISNTALTVNNTGTPGTTTLTNSNNTGGAVFSVTGGVNGTGAMVLNNNGTLANGITLGTGAVNNVGMITNSGTGTGGTLISSVIGTNVTGVVENSANSSLTLSGTNTYTSGLTINNGTVITINAAAAGATHAITLGGTAGNGGGSASLLGNTFTVTNTINLVASAVGTLTIGNNGTNTLPVFGGAIALAGNNLTVQSTGTTGGVTLSGAITGSGNLTLTDNSTTTGAILLSNANLNTTGTITNSGTGTGTATISSVIGSNVMGVIENSSGNSSLTLSAVNTYTGATSITAGTLSITATGTINGTSGVTVNGGNFNYNNSTTAFTGALALTSGTLSGTGTISTVGGVAAGSGTIVAPGNSPTSGSLTVTTGLTLSGTSTYLWTNNEGNTAGVVGTGFSSIIGGGAITLSGGSLSLVFNSSTDFASGLWSTLHTWDIISGNITTGTAYADGSITISGSSLSLSGAADSLSQGTFSTAISGGDLILTWTPTPAGGVPAGSGTWHNGTGDGKWTTNTASGSNWNVGIPNAADQVATFDDSANGGAGTVDLDGDKTVSGINLYTASAGYTIGLPSTTNTLNFQTTTGNAKINVTGAGSHTINALSNLVNATDVSVAAGGSLNIVGAVSGAGALSLTGGGTLTLSSAAGNSYGGGTTVNGGTLIVSNTSGGSATGTGDVTLNGGTLGGGGSITGNVIAGSGLHTIAPSAGLSPTSTTNLTVGGLTTNANTTLSFNLNGGVVSDLGVSDTITAGTVTLNGGNIVIANNSTTGASSLGYYKLISYTTLLGTGAANLTLSAPAGGLGVVYTLDTTHAGSIDVHRGFLGDANDDGVVNFSDFVALSNHFGSTVAGWSGGDFNADGVVNFSDFVALSNHFGATILPTSESVSDSEVADFDAAASSFFGSSSVPEPTSLALLGLGAVALLKRRRKA